MRCIQLKNGNNFLPEGYCDFNVDSSRNFFEFSVIVDESTAMDNYKVETESDGFLWCEKVGNMLYVTLNENNSVDERYGFVKVTHNMDSSVFYQANFTQNGMEYAISFSNVETSGDDQYVELFFNPLTGKDDANSESMDVYVECHNGFADFMVKKIEMFTDDSTMSKKIPYDNAFLMAKGNGKLTITNYGKISLLDNPLYKITICHKNDRSKCKEIIIRYNNSDTSEGFAFDDD